MASATIHSLDMTVGKPMRLLVAFALPIFLGNVFQLLYNMIDSIVVGRFVGAGALAAVGTCASPYNLLMNLNIGVANGVGLLIAQCFGAKREEIIQPLIANAMGIMMVTSLLIGTAGFLLAPWMLRLIDVPEDIIADATIYLRLMFLSLLGAAIYHVVASVLRALGDSQTPLYFLLFSSILNTVMDILCVTLLNLGVFGVALSTVISQYIVAAVTLFYARRKYAYFAFTINKSTLNRHLVKRILSTGIPMALQASTISLSAIILQSFVNSFGSVVIAARTAALRFDNIVNLPLGSLATAMSTYTGQNIGAGKIDRIRDGVKFFWVFSAVFSAVMFLLGHFCGESFMRIFVREENVIAYGCDAIRISSASIIFLANIHVNRAIINGSGDTRFSALGGMMEVVGRVGFACLYILVLKIGVSGLWYTNASSWVLTGAFFLIRFLSGKWKTKSFVYAEGLK